MAYQYHQEGCNCAQSVALAFQDLTGLSREQTMAVAGGFGGGVGGSRAELCGAVSGAVMVLGLLNPGTGAEGKKRISALSREFRRRFEEDFGKTRCGELLAARPGISEKTRAAGRLGITGHCDIMIVTAVEILEQMLSEQPE